jgi:hypothetical protein
VGLITSVTVGHVGAQEIIKEISSRRTVTKLILGHNSLGDDGTVALFTFLNSSGSNSGSKYKQTITEISLNGNGISNKGLEAIILYLQDNSALKELSLSAVRPLVMPSVTSLLTITAE